ncbi:DNA internalization-related competence protein ComEC/Rec2 [Acetivibrio clariflavus]|uniref:DNA internalization-related competence protein ComEC/Rec2 n=1 Tax=Acetivibrio clariflavus (strain DSM 19732 / NBRC 101661 / EBR45) TaxID=720554 RepID=G8M0M7_ACECE|nr:DNA internalization-related competence protein ComEC/Rec2 [Acetivibrio clariflavus]AEV69108.1 DNA internalization-related competence protein ComEC/Rec2 [Acetivibrio clariflavus DSM 19732]
MNRPLVLFCASYMSGILLANLTRSYWFIIYSAIVLAIIAIAFGMFYKRHVFLLSGVLILYFFGGVYYLYTYNQNANRFVEYNGKQVTVKGYINSAPNADGEKIVYELMAEEVFLKESGRSDKVSGKIRLTTLLGDNGFIDYGREVTVSGTLNIPKERTNPSGFNYRSYLSHSGISATLFAMDYNINVGEKNKGNFLVKLGLKLRERIVTVINKSLPPQQAGLLNGMLIGYKQDLSQEVEEAFSASGLSHIMAVSGSNVAFIILPLAYVFKKLKIRQKLANLLIIIILILFVLITGFEPSVLRAVIMAVVVLVGQIIRRDTEIFTSISFSALVLLFYNPGILFNIGFQLSFAATLSLVLFYKNLKEMLGFKFLPPFILDVLAATISAQIGVLPITVFYFNTVSLVSIISNLLVVPIVEFITILGSLMALLGQIHIVLSILIGYVNNVLLSFVLVVTKISAQLPWSVKTLVTPSIFSVICYYAVIIYFFWYRPEYKVKLKLKYGIAAVLIILGTVFYGVFIPKGLEVVFIDVGQGDSTFIQTSKGKNILIDGGGYSSAASDSTSIGENIVIPFLLDYGVDKLDLVIATHGHDDHIQGLIPVLKKLKVECLVIPEVPLDSGLQKLCDIARKEKIKIQMCSRGDLIRLDNKTYFDVLMPKKGDFIQESPSNNNSLVVKLHYEKVRILFTADMEKEAEEMLIRDNVDLKSDVLKVAHHGSDTSTTEAFLERINPDIAVISVGRNNFGHPSKYVLNVLEKNRVKIFRTDYDGAVVLKTYGKDIKIKRTVKKQSVPVLDKGESYEY